MIYLEQNIKDYVEKLRLGRCYMADDKPLSISDLQLLMESYKNTIQLNTVLMEQQKQVLEKQGEIIGKQNETVTTIHNILIQMKDHTEDLVVMKEALEASCTIKTQELQQVLSKEHNSLSLKLYGGIIGLGLMVLSLIGFTVKAFAKFDLIDSIVDKLPLIDAIAKSLGVG